jgi:asparagine synthase (glutamine-hydrolysing)
MHHSIEARSPFLDHKLWEFAASLPFDLRLRGGRSKAILRELARRRIDDRVATGSKRGFGIPVQRWIIGRWYEGVKESFSDSMLAGEGWINSTAAISELEKARQRGSAPKQLWYIYVLEEWLRRERAETLKSRETPESMPIKLTNGARVSGGAGAALLRG